MELDGDLRYSSIKIHRSDIIRNTTEIMVYIEYIECLKFDGHNWDFGCIEIKNMSKF